MEHLQPYFIVIDDSKLNCFIADKIIRYKGKYENVMLFTESSEAFIHISNSPQYQLGEERIIILDIYMPVMNGFEFVEAFEKLAPEIKNGYAIFMISSSVNENDHNRIANYPSVKKLLNKPITKEMITEMVDIVYN